MKRLFISIVVLLTAAIAPLHAKSERQKTVEKFESCEAIIREFMDDPRHAIPSDILRGAKAIVITNQVGVGAGIGGQYGYGVVMAKRPDGSWSVPVLVRAGEGSLGLQLGSNTVETVYIINDASKVENLYLMRFNIGVEARAVATPRVASAEKVNETLPAPAILSFSKRRGYFAGASVKTGWVARNDEINFRFYNTELTLPELLYNQPSLPVPEELSYLVNYITRITR